MAVKNRLDTSSNGESKYLDTRDIKEAAKGLKIRLYGDQEMGYSYFQKKDDGSNGATIVRSVDIPVMENQTDGYKGAEQKPAKNLYSVVWNYETNAPALASIDKVSIIDKLFEVEDSEDTGSMTDYDFRITFDKNAEPANKYKVVRLDKTDLTKEQKDELKAFTCDLEAHAKGGSAFESDKKEAEAQYEELEAKKDSDVPF